MTVRKRYLVMAAYVPLTSALCVAAEPPDSGIRTFEFLTYRVSILSVDDAAVLFDWFPERYLQELRSQENGTTTSGTLIEWVVPYDGVVWGRDEEHLSAQFYTDVSPADGLDWSYFERARDVNDTVFPADTRLLGLTDRFAYQGWCDVALDFYALDQKDEFRQVWASMRIPQQIFLSCASPEGAFTRFALNGRNGEIDEHRTTLADGRLRRELSVRPAGSHREYHLRIDSASPDHSASWRFVRRDRQTNASLVFLGQWRETTGESERFLPTLPADTLEAHADIKRITTVGVRDRTGLGLWDEQTDVEYLGSSPGIAVHHWFSSNSGRLLTNTLVFFVLFSLLWKERQAHPSKEIRS